MGRIREGGDGEVRVRERERERGWGRGCRASTSIDSGYHQSEIQNGSQEEGLRCKDWVKVERVVEGRGTRASTPIDSTPTSGSGAGW